MAYAFRATPSKQHPRRADAFNKVAIIPNLATKYDKLRSCIVELVSAIWLIAIFAWDIDERRMDPLLESHEPIQDFRGDTGPYKL
jgi:hypothetical protein